MHDVAGYVSAKFDVILFVRFSDKVSKPKTLNHCRRVTRSLVGLILGSLEPLGDLVFVFQTASR